MPNEDNTKSTKLRFMYVPTNRDCSQTLPQFLEEAAWAAKQSFTHVVFCLIENSISDEISKKHIETLKQASPKVQIIHFTEARQTSFIDTLLADTSLDISCTKKLLLPAGISYGRGPNLAYLLAESLGAASVHRRDSDITLDKNRLPVEMELGAIDRPFNQLKPALENTDPERYDNNAVIKIVGTGVYGDPTIDRRDLIAAGHNFLTAFQALGRPGAEPKQVEKEAINYLITEPQTIYDKDFYRMDAGQIEMDAVCISDIYRHLPEMPTDILGNDYMVNDLNWHLHQPALFHSRKVKHEYDKPRNDYKDLGAATNYSLRDVQYIQIGIIWAKVGEQLEQDKIYDELAFDAQHYAAVWREKSKDAGPMLTDVRVGAQQVYTDAANATKGKLSNRLQSVADALNKAGESFDQHVLDAVNDYTQLVEVWPMLMKTTKAISKT